MEQIFQDSIEQEVSLDRNVGSLFADFLESKNRLAEFDNWASRTLISIDGVVIQSPTSSFPAKVMEILRLIIKPTQEVKFLPIVAGG